MININKSFYSAKHEFELKNEDVGSTFGETIVEYEIYKHTDVSNLKNVKGYLLIVKQRIIIPNPTKYIAGATSITSYKDYPAIIENKIKLDVNNKAKVQINSIFPKTLNSNVTTNVSSHTGKSVSETNQNTTGSSTSNVNTFNIGFDGGAMIVGDAILPIIGFNISYYHSWIKNNSAQNTIGSSSSSQTDQSFANSMSVKDWSAYSSLGDDDESLVWFWGQSYPWDVILYNQSSGGDDVISLPEFVDERLANNGLILPPSELSLFGLDFTSQASWIIEFPEGVTENEIITISHETTSYTASHSVSNKKVSAVLQSNKEANSTSYSPGALDLSLYSIATVHDSATIGFKVNTFTYAPKSHTDKFKIISPTGDMQVMGTGFDSIMTTTFKSDVLLTVYFKINNKSINYSLNLIHWLEQNSGICQINWTINDKHKGMNVINNIQNNEDSDNSTKISLRNLDYTSVNFYNHLVIGINKVQLLIKPADKQPNHQYTFSSITII